METKPEYEVKEWRCAKCGHLLGDVVRPSDGIRQLRLYWSHGVSNCVSATITGLAEIVCPECSDVRTWYAPEEGMREFIKQELDRKLRRLRVVEV